MGELGYDSRKLSDQKLLVQVGAQVPELQVACGMLANVVCVLHTKTLLWVKSPYKEYFVELSWRAAGLGVVSYHADLKPGQRDSCINDFNMNTKVSVLILLYRIGGVDINL